MKSLQEVRSILEKVDDREKLDIIHLLRMENAKALFTISQEVYNEYKKKLRSIIGAGGVYFILVIDPEGDVILYPGKTSGKSKTSGLWFRIKDHIRFLGKTPCTLFIPNWWIKSVYPIPLESNEKSRKLEGELWNFIIRQSEEGSVYENIADLEKVIIGIISDCIQHQSVLNPIELNSERNPRKNFILKIPPAGNPKRL